MKTVEKEHGFFWHWQNLKCDYPKRKGVHGRAWLHRRRGGVLGIEWHLPGRSCSIGVIVGGMEDQLRLSLCLWLFAFYISFERWPWMQKIEACADYHGREVRFAIHNWALWWNVWTKEHEWSSRTPKWRDGCFHIDDFFLGKRKYTHTKGEPQQAVIEMSEGSYPATATFQTQTWKRPRWYRTLIKHSIEIDAGNGVPFPGKGENSWDCGEDGMCVAAYCVATVEEAIERFRQEVLKKRLKYGGKNWKPEKAMV